MATTYTNLADFSSEGFNIGKDTRVMSYLHGLSDFWVYMFEDASKINMLMEANAVTASDVYNKFLQLTSVISLENISTLTNAQVKLVLLLDSDAVPNTVETYTLPKDTALQYARYLVNRAYLPTTKLENEADYYIDEATGQISFAQPLSSLGFPFRTLADGSKQYAIWAVDAKIDDQVIYDHYAKLININPTTSTDLFKNFVYGMYYLFVQGPHLDTLKRGLNIALGIPLARDAETVLEIRKYLNSDQWLVITDLNSYIIPYGLEPTVAVGNQLSVGQDIALWIEVKDHINDGEWWVNFMLPSHLMPNIPLAVPGGGGVNADSTPDRYMTAGSYADWLMRNYLKNHTFLVNVKTLGFKNIQNFQQLADIIRQVKPTYTAPIYVWTVPVMDDILTFQDSVTYSLELGSCESITDGMARFYRGNTSNPLIRDCCPSFNRMSVPGKIDDLSGVASELNGKQRTFQSGTLNGFIAPAASYRTLDGTESAWDRTLRSRHNDQYVPTRGSLDFNRSRDKVGDGTTVYPMHDLYPGYRLVALHTTTLSDVKQKFAACGYPLPNTYTMPLLQPFNDIAAVNEHAVDDSRLTDYMEILMANFDYLFNPGPNVKNIGPLFPKDNKVSFLPSAGAVTSGDFLVFTRILDTYCGVFWATTNFGYSVPPYAAHYSDDMLQISTTGLPTRGGAMMGSPYYQLRSANFGISYNTNNSLNDQAVNEGVDITANITISYEDNYNTSFSKDRSGTKLVTRRTFRT